MSCFPELYARSRNKMKVGLDLLNYATKSDLKNAAAIDISSQLKVRYWYIRF